MFSTRLKRRYPKTKYATGDGVAMERGPREMMAIVSDSPTPTRRLNMGPAKQPANAIVGKPSRAMAIFDTRSPIEFPHAKT